MGPLTLLVGDSGPPRPELLNRFSPDTLERLAAEQFYWSATGDNAELSGTAPSKEQAAQDCEAAALDMLPDGFKETWL